MNFLLVGFEGMGRVPSTYHLLELNVRQLQLARQLHRHLEVHIIVARAVDQIIRLVAQSQRLLRQAAVAIAVAVVRLQAHVTFRVQRVVTRPVGDRGHRGTAAEHVRAIGGHHHAGGVTAVAPAPDADAVGIDVFERAAQLTAFVCFMKGVGGSCNFQDIRTACMYTLRF